MGTKFGALLWGVSAFLILSAFGFSENAWGQTEEELYNQAMNYRHSQDWSRAISAFESFIQTYPNSSRRPNAELYLGHAYLSRSNYLGVQDGTTGRGHLQYVIDLGTKSELYRDASLQYAFSLFSLMMYDEACPALEKFIAEFPDSSDLQYAYYYLGVCESGLGRYVKAKEYFDKCIEKFPNGALKDQCQLDRAITLGRSGQYDQADYALQRLALNPQYPFAQKATLQRALIRIAQENYAGALTILDGFFRDNPNTAAATLVEAYQYQAYCYMQQGQSDQALQVIGTLEKISGGNTPETAFLKVRILTKMERFDEALAQLEQIRRSEFSLTGSDVINYYHSTILLAQGKWDDAIKLLVSFLNLASDPNDSKRIVINYFSAPTSSVSRLRPRDYMEACGVLVLSFVSRYAVYRNEGDRTAQESVFNAMYSYADSQPDPYLMMIVTRIARERQVAFTKPIAPSGDANDSLVVVGRTDSHDGVPAGGLYPQGGSGGNAPAGSLPPAGTNAPAAAASTVRIDENEANAIFVDASRLYVNNKLDLADEKLLKLFTGYDNLWEDCPNIAAPAALLRAKILFDLKKYNEAQTMCNTLVKMAPNTAAAADANYFLGFRYDYFGQRDAAIEYFTQAINSPYEGNFRDRAYYALGWNEWERKNTVQAENCFYKIYRNFPNSSYWGHAVWAAAQIEYQAHDYPAAERLVNEAIASHPDRAIVDRLLFLKGEIALTCRDYPKARIAFNAVASQYPDSVYCSAARNRLDSLPKNDNQAPAKFD